MVRNTTRRRRAESPTRFHLALCIPFDIGDLHDLPQCLLSIHTQFRQPDLIVFSFSRVPTSHQEGIRSLVADGDLLPPVTCLFSDCRLFAGANRNRAAAEAIRQGATHISFFDADDIAHPRRLELIERTFTRIPNLGGVLHSFISLQKGRKHSLLSIPWRPIRGEVMEKFLYPILSKKTFWRVGAHDISGSSLNAMDIANGHASVRSDVWEAAPFHDELRMGEDNHFNAKVMAKGYTLVFLSDSLSAYLT